MTGLQQKIAGIHQHLGIPDDYAVEHRLEVCEECTATVSIGEDIHGRGQRLVSEAALAWYGMRDEAASQDVQLQVVSAFRSIDYQADIIRAKLEAGQAVADILRVSAAPGYSEHHTGRALDLTTPGFEPLEEEFENSPAFAWLNENAARHGFRLSFPRDNPHGVAYEPWHWFWTG